ncbi:MAG: transporter [Deltaproteobacteria bacterium]|nr:transporter [Deltaproteobacteria bacterium]
MLRRRWLAICLVMSLAASDQASAAVGPAAAKPSLFERFKVSLGYHYSIGDYGESERTTIQYVPLVLTADIDRWRVQATIPYLNIDGPAGIIEGPNGPIQTTDGDASGLGDLLLRGAYLLPIERALPQDWSASAWLPYVDLVALLKIPTASRGQGLGTGEVDFGVESELTWSLGAFSPFATLGYRYLGSPPDQHLSDVFVGSLGALYRFLPSLSAGALLDYRTSPSPDTGQQLDLVPYAAWRITDAWSLESYVSAGLADGSPDVGVGFQLGYSW